MYYFSLDDDLSQLVIIIARQHTVVPMKDLKKLNLISIINYFILTPNVWLLRLLLLELCLIHKISKVCDGILPLFSRKMAVFLIPLDHY